MSNIIPSVVIIGAGASGIAAASRLFQNGITNIKILEAESRIGGRVNSVEFDGSIVDLGGQWVHGEKGNIVYEMVKDLDLLSTSFNTYQDNSYYLPNDKNLDKNVTDKMFKIGMQVMDDQETAAKYPGPFGNYFVKVYNQRISEEFKGNEEILELAKYFQEWFHKFYTCLDSAKSWFDISIKGAMHDFEHCEGDQQLNWRKRGFRTILDVLMKKIPDASKQLPLDDKIFLNKEITKIIWDELNQSNKKLVVQCKDGSSYEADHVIVTVSVGVLKKFHNTLFVPKLPPNKVNSIEHISLGVVNKVLLKFPTKWWPDETKGFSLLWTEDPDVDHLDGVSNLNPTDVNGRSWVKDVFGFYVIDSHPKVLLAWIVGKLALQVEYCTDQEIITSLMAVLNKFLGRKYKIPQPDGILRSKWGSNPHFCGSYVYSSIDQENHNASANDLAKPLFSKTSTKPAVLFAGEATSAHHYSTVHGAIETGFREADRLINLYK